MKTFILLTFGFLGFAFYQMSGGSDFQPASARLQAAPDEVLLTAQSAPVTRPSTTVAGSTDTITKIDSTPDVTRVALNLTNVAEANETAAPEPANTARIIDSSETPQIILPSLIATTNDSNRPGVGNLVIDGDVRTVSGNRVNVRGGPSTNFGVVNKLTRGDEVRILEDNGDGWVRMQPLDGGEAGWMADFLLTSG
ncbi:SH3 domain-containing protein [Sulfitobacter guttiformis]|uniref:SH3 domain-containing protein n=1 Tax=Sulfitobacter guttiformis TaxID=74349 RepID=A0A420DQG4_9RHOB|nr:SH3 domain-containing protein [Sulfitobacter guttiformis]KIN73924.1 SH3, type 3 domain protein [Sulfitobacter guttiformis KCTC 32187]RKE96551.1 SH3 domain-containing protein [Sulfitobacter guttiformis]